MHKEQQKIYNRLDLHPVNACPTAPMMLHFPHVLLIQYKFVPNHKITSVAGQSQLVFFEFPLHKKGQVLNPEPQI